MDPFLALSALSWLWLALVAAKLGVIGWALVDLGRRDA